jgi:hypothetical protein
MTSRKYRLASAAAATACGIGLLAVPVAANAKPDTSCQRAGIKTLQSAGLLDDVARNGLPIATAVSLGVTVRPGADLSGVPDPLPLPLILADHRAGAHSIFVYPWC